MAITPRVTIPDDLFDFYETEAIESQQPIESVIEYRLRHGQALAPSGRFVILSGAELTAIEARLGGGHVMSAKDLVTKVARLGSIQFGHHEIRMTPGQMEEIAFRARKQGKTIAQVVQAVWMRLQDEFFRHVA